MGKKEGQAYLKAIRGRYAKANRAEKGKILDEFCAVCGYAREYALRLLGCPPPKSSPAKPGRPSRYECEAVLTPLRAIWLATDQMAPKRLSSVLPLWLPRYEATHGPLEASVQERLLAVSPAAIDRLLGPRRAEAGRRGLSGTKPSTLLKNGVPLHANTWGLSVRGFM